MSINNIDLPAYSIAALYNHHLVADVSSTQPAAAEPILIPLVATTDENKKWKYLGDNQKNVLILVSNNQAVHLPDNELNFLTGILTACKLSLADVAILNRVNHPEAGYDKLTVDLKTKTALLFGISPVLFDLPMNFPPYQVQHFNGVNYLHAPALSTIENDKGEKMQLWNCLKRIFEL